MIAALAVLGCERPPAGTDPPPPPEELVLTAEPTATLVNPAVPLARLLSFATEVPSEATVTWSDGDLATTVELPAATEHELPLLRMRADRDVEVHLTLRAEGATAERTLTFHTASLPPKFPDVTVHQLDADAMEPGDTLVGVVAGGVGAWQIVLSPEGEIVWWWARDPRMLELQLRSDGMLLGNAQEGALIELDWLGRIQRQWVPGGGSGTTIPVALPTFHHDVQRLPDGTMLAMSKQNVTVQDFPASYDDPLVREDATVRDDEIVLLAQDGTVIREIPYSTAIPYERIGYTSLVGNPKDWVHGNGVAWSPENDAIVISSRAQDALAGLDLDGTVRWILANPANWPTASESLRLQPVGQPFRWPYKQHAPEWFGGDRIMMFDNGNRQASPWTGEDDLGALETWSRVVEYRIDEQAMTVEQAWEFEIPGVRLFGDYMGDADHLPNGDVLGNFAGVIAMNGRYLADYGLGRHLIRLVEFVPETGELLWDVELSSDMDEVPDGWNSYRSQRLPVGWEAGAVSDLP